MPIHINLTFWTEAKGERVVAFGSGNSMREAMIACFAPVGSARQNPGKYIYTEENGIGILTRVSRGQVVARWRGVPSGQVARRELTTVPVKPLGNDGDEKVLQKLQSKRVRLDEEPVKSKRIKL